jgi:sugar phosphate isomerase/epimerase
MRFGIMAMQLQMLIPNNLSPEKIMTHVSDFNHAQLVRELSGYGFKVIELGGDLSMFMPHTFSHAAIEGLQNLKDELGISYTVHLPLWSVEPSTPLTHVRQGSVNALIETIQQTKSLQPEAYVLHATGALAAEFYRMRISEIARAILLRQFQAGARQSVQTILKETGIPSRQLAVETIEFPFELTMEIVEEFNLSFCLDTGHILAGFSGTLTLENALEKCLPRLVEIHLHDCPWQGPEHHLGYGKDHQALGKGDLDVASLLDRLDSADYKGPLIFELTVPEAVASLETIKHLRPGLVG